jgi:hypothetical protein
MPSLKLTLPYFPQAPQSYEKKYLDNVVQSFSFYLQQQQNPGDSVLSTLNLLELKTFESNAAAVAGGLSVNDVYKTSTGDLKIVMA